MRSQPFGFILRGLAVLVASAFAAGSAGAAQDTSAALVQLNGDPLATFSKTKPAQGKKIDFDSNTVKSYRAQLSALRNDYKAWLRKNVPQAKITGDFDISLNAVAVQLNGASLDQVAAAPMVKNAEFQNTYRPTITDPDLALINAEAAWSLGGGPANAGDGVKVAIVDTGIDVTHPCFSDAGYPNQPKSGPPALTNNKVIVAKVFNNKSGSRQYTPAAIGAHGTHVAGTVACNYQTPTNVDGVAVPYSMSGVAPRALLGNYNVFPADVENARSEDILNALEAAYADGFDVANMSLGGGSHGVQDLLTTAVDNLDQANMVVAVAAGNSGPGLFTVESPGSAARALTAGASSVNHFMGHPINTNGTSYGGVQGLFGDPTADLSANILVYAGPTTADANGMNGMNFGCGEFPAAASGKIVMVTRGSCFFTVKVRNAQAAGAVALIVADNRPGDPILMGDDGTPDQPTLPAYSVSLEDGQSLLAANGMPAVVADALQYYLTTHQNIMADFSSQGPTDVDFRVKPDVVAPGVNVLSSVPASECAVAPCFAFYQGTSMATPHLAGSAAFVRGLHPDWSAADIRSAVVNTATRGVLFNPPAAATNTLSIATSVNVVGAGIENLAAAATASALLSPVSVSFGAVPMISGQTRSAAVTITNGGAGSATWNVSTTGGDASVGFTVAPNSVTLAPGASTTVVVTMTAAKGAAPGSHQGSLEVGSAAHAALYAIVK
jgi:subtilisin family serine protease